jgi:hypothetical protein
MLGNVGPQPGDVYLELNGRDAYVEIPSIADYSVSTTGELTNSAWLRPDILNFPSVERNSDYIHWLGKGETSGAGGNQEWAFRMYNHSDPLNSPSRPNRISFYLFNPQGGLGVGSYVQVPIHKGKWIHIVGVADSSRTYLYKDGQYIRCDTYRGPARGAPRNGLRGSRYRPRQRLSALSGNEHKIKPRALARHIGNSSIACRTGDCPASCRKIQRQPKRAEI